MEEKIWSRLVILLSIFAILLSTLSLVLTFTTINSYKVSLAVNRRYDLRMTLDIEFLNGSKRSIVFSLEEEPQFIYNEDNTFSSSVYRFQVNNLGLTATFRYIILAMLVPEDAYKIHTGIEAKWNVGGAAEGIIKKTNMVPSKTVIPYYVGTEDITRYMWKENVPTQIEVIVTLSN